MDSYNYIKSLHLIFVITWFAGLFYIPRIFIYHIEASKKATPEKEILGTQLKLMAKQSWMHAKLGFVMLLIMYHIKTHLIFKQLQKDQIMYTSNFMRIWNEGATLLLFAVVFLVLLKSTLNMAYGMLALVGLAVLLMLGIKLHKRTRSE